MISNANSDKNTKAFLNIIKLIFYLCFYLHLLACYKWIIVKENGPKLYMRDYAQDAYVADDGTFLLDEQNEKVRADERYEWEFSSFPTFGDHDWERLSGEDASEHLNERWSSRTASWIAPLDWVNFDESQIFNKEYSIAKRYYIMLYYSVMI